MKLIERIFRIDTDKNLAGEWKHYYLFGKKVRTKLVCLYKYTDRY